VTAFQKGRRWSICGTSWYPFFFTSHGKVLLANLMVRSRWFPWKSIFFFFNHTQRFLSPKKIWFI